MPQVEIDLLGDGNYLGPALLCPTHPLLPSPALPSPALPFPALPSRLFRLSLLHFLFFPPREGERKERVYFMLSWKECQKFILQAILKIMRQKPKTQDEVKETSRKEIFTSCWRHCCLQQLAKLFPLLLGTENRE